MRTWSFSSLNTYYTCPRQYDLQYNKQVIPYQETEATIYGSRVHKALEDYARDRVPLPDDCKPFQKYVDKLLSLDGERFFERQFALDRSLRPCAFDDANAWCRGVIDVGVVGGHRAIVADYKTGKKRPESDQLKLFAGFVFAHYPSVERVRTSYIWLKHGELTTETYTHDQVPEIWKHFMEKVRRLEDSYEKDKWVPKPSGLCNGWCGAGRENCEFWSPKRS